MGIPAYYKTIINACPDIITTEKKVFHNLFLDLNCAIHPCCANKTDENEMMDSIFDKIIECITITNVSDLVYIAIDGPAPRAKMEQQRHRRLKSAKEKKIWDTNAITPGTPFMNKLNLFLKEKCKLLKIKYIISDSNEPGEGEHKIMSYMDQNINKTDNNAIYGLDADLIMLSMIRKHNNIFLLRERTEYNIENITEPYVYLDIEYLKQNLILRIKEPFVNEYNITDQQILNDYIFMCFLIGNDFIVSSPCISMRCGGEGYLTNFYSDLQNDYFGNFYLVDNDKINLKNFKIFINKIASNESRILDKIVKKRRTLEYRNRTRYIEYFSKIKSIDEIKNYTYDDFPSNNEYEFEKFVNFSPQSFRNAEKFVFKDDNYRKRYYIYNIYNKLEVNPSYEMIIKDNITQICSDYLKTIEWTYNYYFNSCISWRWYYKYPYAPLMIDLDTYLEGANHAIFPKDKPYTPKEQLEIVLPFQKKNNYYYPKDTPLYSFMKHYFWECHQILPD
jgi:5'-3' exoribonuclease 2